MNVKISAITAVIMFLPQLAVAQSASDWQNTAKYIRSLGSAPPGCDSLEWIGWRVECQNTEVGKHCKQGAIESGRPMYEQAETQVVNRRNVLKGIGINEEKFRNENDPTKKKEWESEVSKGKDRLKKIDEDLDKRLSALQQNLRAAETCAKARGEIGKIFVRAADKGYAVSDPVSKADAQFAADAWKKSDVDHKDQRIAVNIIVEDCKSGIQVIERK